MSHGSSARLHHLGVADLILSSWRNRQSIPSFIGICKDIHDLPTKRPTLGGYYVTVQLEHDVTCCQGYSLLAINEGMSLSNTDDQ